MEAGDRWQRPVTIRDSKDRSGPALVFASDEWRAFVADVKTGAHDLAG